MGSDTLTNHTISGLHSPTGIKTSPSPGFHQIHLCWPFLPPLLSSESYSLCHPCRVITTLTVLELLCFPNCLSRGSTEAFLLLPSAPQTHGIRLIWVLKPTVDEARNLQKPHFSHCEDFEYVLIFFSPSLTPIEKEMAPISPPPGSHSWLTFAGLDVLPLHSHRSFPFFLQHGVMPVCL